MIAIECVRRNLLEIVLQLGRQGPVEIIGNVGFRLARLGDDDFLAGGGAVHQLGEAKLVPYQPARKKRRFGQNLLGITLAYCENREDASGSGMDTEKTNGEPAPPAITSFSPNRSRILSLPN